MAGLSVCDPQTAGALGAAARIRASARHVGWSAGHEPAVIAKLTWQRGDSPDDHHRFPGPCVRGEHTEATLAQCAELARSVTGDEMVAAMDKVGVDGAIFISAFSMYQYDASYAVEVQQANPGRFAIVKPVNPDDPAVADVIATGRRRLVRSESASC